MYEMVHCHHKKEFFFSTNVAVSSLFFQPIDSIMQHNMLHSPSFLSQDSRWRLLHVHPKKLTQCFQQKIILGTQHWDPKNAQSYEYVIHTKNARISSENRIIILIIHSIRNSSKNALYLKKCTKWMHTATVLMFRGP